MDKSTKDKSRDPEYLRDITVEYFRNKFELGFFSDMSPENVMNGFSFRHDAIQEDGGLRAMSYLDDSLQSSIARAQEEHDRGREALSQRLQPLWTDVSVGTKVNTLIEDELKRNGWSEETLKKMEFAKKGLEVAKSRSKLEITLSSTHRDFQQALSTHEFQVYLRMLHYGYGDIVDTTILTIPYGTTFHDFLWILQEQTVLCTIPPRDLCMDARAFEGGQSLSRESSQTLAGYGDEEPEMFNPAANLKQPYGDIFPGAMVESQSAKAKQYQGTCQSPLLVNAPTEQAKSFVHSSNEKGYTLDKGPWHYKIAVNGACFRDISIEDNYKEMLSALKARVAIKSERSKVVMMHSMDRRAWDLCLEKERALEREDEIRRVNSNTAEMDDWFDKTGGRSMDWFAGYQQARESIASQPTSQSQSIYRRQSTPEPHTPQPELRRSSRLKSTT